jgi:hydrogenase maturation factor
MTEAQKQALESLQSAMRDATECGAFDVLNDYLNSPDSINDVVDSLGIALALN